MRIRVISLLLAGLLPFAQDQQRPVFRTGVNLVRLDVRVVDGSGQPIPDLKAEEIEVIEGGVKRPLLLFQRVSGPSRSYAEQAQRTIASDVSTNQGAPQGQLFVLVIDQDHIRPGGEQPIRVAAETFLRTRVKPQDRVAIYGLPGPGPAQPFTANFAHARQQLDYVRAGLVRKANGAVTEMTEADAYEILRGNENVLMRYMTREASTSVADASGGAGTDVARRLSEDPAVTRRLIRENAQSIAARADSESRFFLKAFADLLRSFRGIDGRKTVLLFSEGFFGDNVSRDVEDVAAAAAETYSVVYAFDLNKRAHSLDATEPAYDGTEISSRLEPLGSLAVETSGDLVKDASARIEQAIASLQPDDGSYYLLGFEPGQPVDSNAYRRIKVQVRRSGARALARTGYAMGADPATTDRRRAIDAVLAAPFTQQTLKIEYTTYVAQPATAAGVQKVALSLLAELPIRRGVPSPGTDAKDTAADVVFVVRDTRTGKSVASGSDQIPLPERADGSGSTGSAPWRVLFEVPAGDYIMRCVVREPGGIVGSADRRFTVRPLNGFDVAATDFVVSSPGDPFPVRARAYGDGTLAGTLRLYGPTSDDLQPVLARLQLTPAGEDAAASVGRSIDGTIGEVITTGTRSMRDVLFSMPLERLAAGQYIAHVTVRVKGEIVADLRRPVDVILGAPPAAGTAPAGGGARARNVLDGEIARRLIRQAASTPGDAMKRAGAEADRGNWQAVLDQLRPIAAEDDAARRLRGVASIGQERYADAAVLLGASFEAKPDDAGLAFVLGWARSGAADRVGAVSAFRNAALLDPSMVPAHMALAEMYVALGHPELAVQSVEAGLKAVPQSVELSRLLATLKK
jgi:VWFA-related protein